ncbi:MAG: type IV toxin-antitoxin system AbiEi family antitoxin domain-containing protein [Massilibacteroides sp.]|nr:type IV toxin-antitoxin system AbiEi family antitoxin domain-containing protein [Massilibacteroides sp.]MDD3062432.1 type IV toxin-antitoxin system AbiEi family antitoxin domain-containing protein [Massilibacteroides sp.]MDD4661026.1 type IV toxin-antitoxin system AbiEi family antitoxin domain-containing protein [Massilibacteroides sp.]
MSIEKVNKLNRLLQKSNLGGLYFSAWLKENGYSDQLLKKYRDSGWLTTLAKGVMIRTGDKLRSFSVLESYNEQLKKNFHIAAHSALELSGFNHYVPMGKPLLIIGHPKQEPVPAWMLEGDFDRSLKFFSTGTFPKPQLVPFNVEYPHLQASVPEQAFLECLLLAPKKYSYMDLYYIMEQLTTLRPLVLQPLLENTDNLKVKRMFLFMAEKAGHYWFHSLDTGKLDLGSAKHQLVENGVYVSKYKITVPKELYEYE